MKKIGIDIGYCRTKGVSGAKVADRFSFLSVVSDSVETFGLSEIDGLQFDNPAGMVGEAAAKFGGFVARYENRDWYFSDAYRRIYLAALSQATASSCDILIVSGLPFKFWFSDASALKNILAGTHTFKRRDRKTQTVNVRAVVTVQGFGAVFNHFMSWNGVISDERRAFAPIGVIDAGSKTTNLLSINDLTAIPDECESVQRGGWDLVTALRDRLVARYRDLDLSDYETERAMIDRSLRYKGEIVSLKTDVDEILAAYVTQIKAVISQRWRGAGKMEFVLLTGGGAYLLASALKKEFPHLLVDSDPIYSNAVGYYKYSQACEV